jgi:hypothetical protein
LDTRLSQATVTLQARHRYCLLGTVRCASSTPDRAADRSRHATHEAGFGLRPYQGGILVVTSTTTPGAWLPPRLIRPPLSRKRLRRPICRRCRLMSWCSPIALYPDALVVQILAGSTFPDQVVTANAWVQAANSKLNAAELMKQVDAPSWGPQH